MESNHHRCYTEHLSRMPQQTNICLPSGYSKIVGDVGFEPTAFLMYRIYSLALLHRRSRSPKFARVEGFEPSLPVLETGRLPLSTPV